MFSSIINQQPNIFKVILYAGGVRASAEFNVAWCE